MRRLLLLSILVGSCILSVRAQWTQVGPKSLKVKPMGASPNGTLFIGTMPPSGVGSPGVFRSDDNGHTWQLKSSGLPKSGSNYTEMYDIDFDGDTVYMTVENSGGKLFRSTNNGESWVLFGTQANGLKNANTITITPHEFIAYYGGVVFRSSNKGASWQPVDTITGGLSNMKIQYLNGVLYEYQDQSTDGGLHWTTRGGTGELGGAPTGLIQWSGDTLYGYGYLGVYQSVDNGKNWTRITDYSGSTPSSSVARVLRVNRKLFVWTGSSSQSVWVTEPPFTSWGHADADLPGDGDRGANSVVVQGGSVLVGMGRYGVMRSEDDGAHWRMSNDGLPGIYQLTAIASSGPNLLTLGGAMYMLRSDNNGETWVQSSNGMIINPSTSCVAMNDTVAVAGTSYSSGYVYRSGDHGATWRPSGKGITNSVNGIAFVGTTGDTIIASSQQRFFRTFDGGKNWTPGTQDFSLYTPRGVMLVVGSTVYAGKNDNLGTGYLIRSTNFGDTWDVVGGDSINQLPNGITVKDGALYVSTGWNWGAGVIWRSDDNGATWRRAMNGLPAAAYTTGVFNAGGRLLAGATLILGGRTLYASPNGGDNWALANDGLPGGYMGLLTATANANYAFVVLANGGGIFRRGLTDFTTGVNDGPVARQSFSLSANYPNPFNPSTTFSFTLERSSVVTIAVYDVTGRLVATLMENSQLAAGEHQSEFNAAGLASGVYYYRVTAAPIRGGAGEVSSKTGKMLLMR